MPRPFSGTRKDRLSPYPPDLGVREAVVPRSGPSLEWPVRADVIRRGAPQVRRTVRRTCVPGPLKSRRFEHARMKTARTIRVPVPPSQRNQSANGLRCAPGRIRRRTVAMGRLEAEAGGGRGCGSRDRRGPAAPVTS